MLIFKRLCLQVQIIQQAIQSFGGKERELNCYICLAHQNETLGVHLYFPFLRVYPEEALQITHEALRLLRKSMF